jgi:hypothetical protein
MHGGQLIKELWAEELQTRLEQFQTNSQGHHATSQQADKREDQVHRTDVFVVGCEQPTTPSMWRVIIMRVIVCVIVGGRDCAHGLLRFRFICINEWVTCRRVR